jgi:DNA replication protein DnaC
MGAKRFLVASRHEARTLTLVGPKGVGKSVAAAYVLADWVRHYAWNDQPSGGRQLAPAIWVKASKLTQLADYGRIDTDWMDAARLAQVVVVDELGHDSTPVGMAALTDLLTARHEARKRTVVTANMAPEDLAKRYGEAWYDRLRNASIVPDLRQEKNLRRRA